METARLNVLNHILLRLQLQAEEYLSRSLSLKRKISRRQSRRKSFLQPPNSINVPKLGRKGSFDSLAPSPIQLQRTLSPGQKTAFCNAHGRSLRVAATLHQLAILCISSRPVRLDEAERLLKQAMELEDQATARAATLQQLGRVMVRRGLPEQARAYFRQALVVYESVYGNEAHVNLATVRHSLGTVAHSLGRFDQVRQWKHFSPFL